MATKQPKWELIENIGDATPLDYGGYFIYRDKTGVYPEEGELLVPDEERPDRYTIYRILLDPLKMVDGYLVPAIYKSDWPHPLESYDEWFHKDLESVASFVGSTKEALEEAFTSDNPIERAEAYRAVADHSGWENFDSDPLHLTRKEVQERYKDELREKRSR